MIGTAGGGGVGEVRQWIGKEFLGIRKKIKGEQKKCLKEFNLKIRKNKLRLPKRFKFMKV